MPPPCFVSFITLSISAGLEEWPEGGLAGPSWTCEWEHKNISLLTVTRPDKVTSTSFKTELRQFSEAEVAVTVFKVYLLSSVLLFQLSLTNTHMPLRLYSGQCLPRFRRRLCLETCALCSKCTDPEVLFAFHLSSLFHLITGACPNALCTFILKRGWLEDAWSAQRIECSAIFDFMQFATSPSLLPYPLKRRCWFV